MGFKSFVLFVIGFAAVANSVNKPWFGSRCDITPVEVLVSALQHDSRIRPTIDWLLNAGLHHLVRPNLSVVEQFIVRQQSRELLFAGTGMVVFGTLALLILSWRTSFLTLIVGTVLIYLHLQANNATDCALNNGLPIAVIGIVFLLAAAFLGGGSRSASESRRSRSAYHEKDE
jgi:hypothetical protein